MSITASLTAPLVVVNGESLGSCSRPSLDETALPTFSWSDEQLPILWDKALLLLEVPSSTEVFDRVSREVTAAVELGATVVWLITSNAHQDVLRSLVQGSVHRERRPCILPEGSVINDRFRRYLANVPFIYTFALPAGTTPMALVFDNRRMCVAYLDESHYPGLTLFVPAVLSGTSLDSQSSLLEELGSIREARSPRQRALRSAAVSLVMIALLVGGVSVARYLSRSYNQTFATDRSYQAAVSSDEQRDPANTLLGRLTNVQLTQAIGDPPADLVASPQDLTPLVRRLAFIGAFSRVDTFTTAILQGPFQSGCSRLRSLADAVYLMASANLAEGNPEQARYSAQKYINLAYAGALCFHDAEGLNKAQAIVELENGQFAFWSDAVRRAVRQSLFDVTEVDPLTYEEVQTPLPQLSDDDPLTPFVAYQELVSEIARAGDEMTLDQQDLLWRGFLERFGQSPRSDEAAFNRVVISTRRHEGDHNPDVRRQLNEDTIAQVDNFVARFPTSYLTDDAALLGVRMSASLGDPDDLRMRLERFRKSFSGGDAISDLTARLGWRVPNNELRFETLNDLTSALFQLLAAPAGATVESANRTLIGPAVGERMIVQFAQRLNTTAEEVRQLPARATALRLFRASLENGE